MKSRTAYLLDTLLWVAVLGLTALFTKGPLMDSHLFVGVGLATVGYQIAVAMTLTWRHWARKRNHASANRHRGDPDAPDIPF